MIELEDTSDEVAEMIYDALASDGSVGWEDLDSDSQEKYLVLADDIIALLENDVVMDD